MNPSRVFMKSSGSLAGGAAMDQYVNLGRFALLVTMAIALTAPSWASTAERSQDHSNRQTVVALLGIALLEKRLPHTLAVQPGRFLPSIDIHRACATPSLRPDSVLVYLPDAGRCEQLAARNDYAVRERIQTLTGRWLFEDLHARLAAAPFVSISPPHSVASSRSECVCANTAPEGVVSCPAQTRNPQTFIATVEFLASDDDGDTLTGEFSYQRDSEPVQAGLPAPLSSSCDAPSGTLSCSVQGIAPAETGIFQLLLNVSDGTATLQLNTLLEIVAPPTEQIFRDGFQRPQCP